MINAHIDEKRAVPLWAAIGAPMVGVPIMVALLALTAPAGRSAPVVGAPEGEPDAGVRTEQVEVLGVEQTFDLETLCPETPPLRG